MPYFARFTIVIMLQVSSSPSKSNETIKTATQSQYEPAGETSTNGNSTNEVKISQKYPENDGQKRKVSTISK